MLCALALIALATLTAYVLSERRLKLHYDIPRESIPVPVDSATLVRGKHVAVISD